MSQDTSMQAFSQQTRMTHPRPHVAFMSSSLRRCTCTDDPGGHKSKIIAVSAVTIKDLDRWMDYAD